MDGPDGGWGPLASTPLCMAEFETGPIQALGRSPWRNNRVGYITGGRFRGERLSGSILPGGGNWSEAGEIAPGVGVGTFDARSVWRTDDGALIHVAYSGRSVIADDVLVELRDPARAEQVDPARYYLRIAPVFETSDPRYAWLNGVLAVGCGRRTAIGIRHYLFAIG